MNLCNAPIEPIPNGFDTSLLVESCGNDLPSPCISTDGKLVFPFFVQENDTGGFRWFEVLLPYKGQSLSIYAKCRLQCAEALQSCLLTDSASPAHILAVKTAFPIPGETNVVIYSPYLIGEKLREFGLWDAIKGMMIEADIWDRLCLVNDLRSDNPYFLAYYPLVKNQINALRPEIDVDAALKECIAL